MNRHNLHSVFYTADIIESSLTEFFLSNSSYIEGEAIEASLSAAFKTVSPFTKQLKILNPFMSRRQSTYTIQQATLFIYQAYQLRNTHEFFKLTPCLDCI